jgi:hypothetical protein
MEFDAIITKTNLLIISRKNAGGQNFPEFFQPFAATALNGNMDLLFG